MPPGILRRMSVDLAELTGRWREAWPGCPPIGHLLRQRVPDRWVRFHSLPLGKRYPVSAGEYHEVLMRYNTVLAAVLEENDCTAIYLVTVEYGRGDLAEGTEPIHVGLHPNASPWMHAVDPLDSEVAYDLHISRERFTLATRGHYYDFVGRKLLDFVNLQKHPVWKTHVAQLSGYACQI